jgi:cytochrome c556
MSLRKITALALASLIAAGIAATVVAQGIDPAIATMTPDQLVEARQEAMKANGGILRSAGSLSGADAVAAAETLIANFTNLPAMYPEGSIVGNSKALPVIWEERDAFDALFEQAAGHASDMKAAAEAGDAAAFGAGARAIGGLCGQCHQKYRAS